MNSSSPFKIHYNNQIHPLNNLNVHLLKRTLINKGCDTVTIRHLTNNLDDEVLFEYEAPVSIYYNDKIWFYGIITKTPSTNQSHIYDHTYEISSPWWYLENLVYQQNWLEANLNTHQKDHYSFNTILKSRVILGQSTNGTTLNISEQLKNIIQYAISAGAPIQMGTCNIDHTFPLDEVKDMSCAEAILRVLKWAPDSSVFFDYSTTPFPTLHILTSKSKPLSTLNFNGDMNRYYGFEYVKLSPRYDLICSGVILKYERCKVHQGQTFSNTIIDAYPPNITGKELKSVVFTIELETLKNQATFQNIKTKYIDLDSIDWWKEHCPSLKNIPSESIKIKDVQRSSVLPNELIEGHITNWIPHKIEEDLITAKISYETNSESIDNKEVFIKLYATSAMSKTYFKTHNTDIISQDQEDIPKGLAKALFEALSTLKYEGNITLSIDYNHAQINSFKDIFKGIGSELKIIGGRKEWEERHGVIQKIEEDIHNNKMMIYIGPEKHLGGDDLIEVLKISRHHRPSKKSSIRTSGLIHSHKDRGGQGKLSSVHEHSGQYKKLVFKDETQPENQIIIETKDIDNGVTVRLRKDYVCHNGALKQRYVLASEPFEMR